MHLLTISRMGRGFLFVYIVIKAVIDLYEPVSDSILKLDLVSWYK